MNTLEELHNDTRTFYLTSGKTATRNDVFHSGILSESIPPEQNPDTFVYDPVGTSAVVSTPQVFSGRSYLSQIVAFDENVLVYHSSPLAVETTLSGVIKFTAYLSMDVPDTDLLASLYAILPDGMSYYLGNDMVRARYRKSLSHAELVASGQTEEYIFDGFYLTVRTLPKGTRLRLILGSVNSDKWQKNYNSGGEISEETAKDARTATIKVSYGWDSCQFFRIAHLALRERTGGCC